MIKDIAVKVLDSGYVCDHCLGRVFAKMLSDRTNEEKGKIVRSFLAMENDSKKLKADQANFGERKGKCVVCGNLFDNLPRMAEKMLRGIRTMDFDSFLIGVKMSDALVMNEESLLEKVGTKYSEPIKSEISRELGGIITVETCKKIDHDKPDVLLIFDIQNNQTEIFSNSLFVYGEYKKFVRGLPQTSSPRYGQTIQNIIAGPFMKSSKATANVLHALGREDKEARCLVWRPFILELKQPVKRKFKLDGIKKQINKNSKVKVRILRFTSKKEIAALKSKRPYKVYKIVVDFREPVEMPEKAKKLVGVVRQKTPSIVLGSKPEKTKNKKIKTIKWKRLNNKRYQFEITAESGLYIKELVSGDSGRTNPSISKVLGNRATVKEFDLIGLKG